MSDAGWIDTTTSRLLLGSVAIVFVMSLVLRTSAELFLFGGRGFGTVYAQTLFWICWQVVARLESTNLPAMSAVSFCTALFSAAVYAAVGVGVAVGLRRRGSTARFAVAALFGVYLVALFIFPQARFGP